MKKHYSLFFLAAASLWRVLAILLGLAAVQFAAAIWLVQNNGLFLYDLLDHFLFRWSAAIALTLIMAVLIRSTGGGYTTGYTMERLRVKRSAQLWWFSLWGILVFLLCWAVQLGIVLGVCSLYAKGQEVLPWGKQMLLLNSYYSSYFHGLLPLSDGLGWVYTTVFYVLLGMTSGLGVIRSFYGKRTLWPLVICLCSGLVRSPLGDYGWQFILCIALVFGCGIGYACLPQNREEVTA